MTGRQEHRIFQGHVALFAVEREMSAVAWLASANKHRLSSTVRVNGEEQQPIWSTASRIPTVAYITTCDDGRKSTKA